MILEKQLLLPVNLVRGYEAISKQVRDYHCTVWKISEKLSKQLSIFSGEDVSVSSPKGQTKQYSEKLQKHKSYISAYRPQLAS